MRGYWQNDAANAEVFTEDRWFKSGDLGQIDEDGFLSIVGRKKELIVTAGGKNVAPAVLEDRSAKASKVIVESLSEATGDKSARSPDADQQDEQSNVIDLKRLAGL